MIVSNDFDPHAADELALQIEGLANKDYVDLTHREIIAAYAIAIGNTVASIECRDCRDLAVEFVERTVPRLLRRALEKAHNQPPTSDHVH